MEEAFDIENQKFLSQHEIVVKPNLLITNQNN
jgi:hypothetical protein